MSGPVRPVVVGLVLGVAAVSIGMCSRSANADGGQVVRIFPSQATWFDPTPTAARSAVKQIVLNTASRYGVPAHVADYHARRESGYRAAARNPHSTAKGVLQVVKGTHEAIIGRRLTLNEHLHMMSDPVHGAAVGMAHIAACMESRPHWTPGQLWQRGHVAGLRSCGTSLDRAAEIYAQRS